MLQTDIAKLVKLQNRLKGNAMTTLTKPPGSKGVLDRQDNLILQVTTRRHWQQVESFSLRAAWKDHPMYEHWYIACQVLIIAAKYNYLCLLALSVSIQPVRRVW